MSKPTCAAATKVCDSSCPGFGWFNHDEIQRCDECAAFPDDITAAEHITKCAICQQRLGEYVASEQLMLLQL